MFYIDNQGVTDPRINLAIEEHVLRNFSPDEEYLMLYINEPSVIMGKHQNVYEEVHVDFVQENDIKVVRRVSGGGTVYHDLGNLNFSFLVPHDTSKLNNYRYFLNPIVEALKALGVPAEINPRNDIVVAGKKISGNAQFSTTKRMVSHGTLLFNSEIIHLAQSLKVKTSNIQSKSIKSVRSPVANIQEYLTAEQQALLDMEQFKKRLLAQVFDTQGTIPTYQLTPADWEVVNRLVEEKYSTWEWNFARSPKFEMKKSLTLDWGNVQVTTQVKKGYIHTLAIETSYEPYQVALQQLAQQLQNTKYEKKALNTALQSISASATGLSPTQILELIWV